MAKVEKKSRSPRPPEKLAKSTIWQYVAALVALYLFTVAIRLVATASANFPFWFDVARDAVISRQIFEQGDIKVQGPSASGTQDMVFHGVLHYYIIGPFYALSHGDPRVVMVALIFLTSLGVLPVIWLTQKLSGSIRTGLLAGLLYACSYDAIRGGIWLSNPSLAAATLPTFFWLLWIVFFERKWRWFPVLAFVLALSQQAAIFFGVLWVEILLAAVLTIKPKEALTWLRTYAWQGVLTYLLGVSTMILAQYQVWRAGVFSPAKLIAISGGSGSIGVDTLGGIITQYLQKLTQGIFPTHALVSLLVLGAMFLFVRRRERTRQVFIALFGLLPTFILLIQYRQLYHVFLGIEALVVIILAWWLTSLTTTKQGRVILCAVVSFFLLSNYFMWRQETLDGTSRYFVPRGAYLRDQLELVDETYIRAQGQPFSISTLTNPFGYNVTWAYLYSWYGQEKYGYVPSWYGADQTGLFGADLLKRKKQPERIHFSISEPGPGIPDPLRLDFELTQEKQVSSTSTRSYFRSLYLDERHYIPKPSPSPSPSQQELQ